MPLPKARREDILLEMRRIAIVGPAGSGKSRLAHDLGEATALRVVYLDRLFWKPGWRIRPQAEWEAIQRGELEGDSWIAEGLQRGTEHLWLDEADTIVFLDASPLVCLWRVTRRRLDSSPGPGLPEGCVPAPFHQAFLKFVRYLWWYSRTGRDRLLADIARRRNGKRIVVLRRDRDLREFLEAARRSKG
jgi:adenylate kinase family enzyme